MRDADVLILGGGVCGLVAARELSAHGLHVLLVEARERLGGRVWTKQDALAGLSLEMGGMFIDRRQASIWAEVERYALAVSEPLWPATWRWRQADSLRDGMPPVPPEALGDFELALLRLAEGARRIDPARPLLEQDVADLDLPLAELFDDLGTHTRDLLASVLGEQVSGSWREASALDLLGNVAAAGSLADYLLATTFASSLADGGAALIDALAADSSAELRLGWPVTHVVSAADAVEARGPEGALSARAAVCALPLNVLRDVRFEPGLAPARAACVARGHIGRGVKVWALVDEAPAGLVAYGPEGPLQLVAHDRTIEAGELLVGFGQGPLDGQDRAAVEEALQPLLPGATVLESCGHDWVSDPYARGTWAVQPAGTLATWQALPGVDGRLVFATADVGVRWASYIDGAVEAGHAAAAQAIELLGIGTARPAR